MRCLPPLLAALSLSGCLTTRTVGRAVERGSRGIETVVDEAEERLVVQELPVRGEQVEVAVCAARRELDVERFELTETTTEGHAWKKGGKLGRNALWLLSAAAGWVGAFGISWENGEGRTVQIGGLGGAATPWQGASALGLALGGLGYGVQQTVAAHRTVRGETHALGTEEVLVRSRDVAAGPLVDMALTLTGGLATTTDSDGHASIPAIQLPIFADDLDVRSADGARAGVWQPGQELRASLLALPADWGSPLHRSLARQVAGSARLAQEGGAPTALPLAQLSTPEGLQAALSDLPPEQQAAQAAAWLEELAPYAAAARAQRTRIHLEWLHNSALMSRQAAASMGAGPLAAMAEPALFQPMDLFRQLPEPGLVGPGSQDPQVVLLETGACAVEPGSQPAGRTLLACHGGAGGERRVLLQSSEDLHLGEARAWALAALPGPPVRQGDGGAWLPTLVPLYAASLFQDAEGKVGFIQVLDEERLVVSGVLGEIGE